MVHVNFAPVLLLACMVVVGSKPVGGTTRVDDIADAEREFISSAEKAREVLNEAVKKAAEKYVQALDLAIKSTTAKGDLDGALKLRTQRDNCVAVTRGQNTWHPVVGSYWAKHKDWPQALELILRADGTFRVPSWKGTQSSDGRWETCLGGQGISVHWYTFPEDRLYSTGIFKNDSLSLTWKSTEVDR